MKKVCTIAFVIVSCSAIHARAAQEPAVDRVYFGRIGKADAVLCIGSDQKTGRYFYKKNGIDIPLQIREKNGNSFVFKETFDEEKEDAVTWTAKASDQRISGALFNPETGKRVPIEFNLKQTLPDTDELNSPASCATSIDFAEGSNNFYAQAKAVRPVKVVKVFDKGSIKVQQVLEPVSETEWLRIAEHPDSKAKERLNSLLQFQLRKRIYRSLDCKSATNLTGAPGGSIEQHFAIRFFTQHVLSVEERIFGDCGGPHPFGGLTGLTFDLSSGELILPNRMFKAAYFDEKGEHQGFTSHFRDMLIRHFSRSKKEEDRLMLSCFNNGIYLDAWLDADGIWFSENNYRVHECGEPFFVPYRFLRETLSDDVARLVGLTPKK